MSTDARGGFSRIQGVRHGSGRVHLERRAVPGPQDDGWQQS